MNSAGQRPQDKAEASDIAAEFTGGERKRSVAQSNADLKRLKTSSKHMLHFCATVLGNPFANALTELTLAVCQPLCRFIDGMRTSCSTAWGSEDFHISLAKGSLQNAVSETWSVLSNNRLLQSAGFLETLNCDMRAAAELENDNQLAEILFEASAEIITQFTLSGLTWTHRYPGFFVGLLDPDAEQQKRNMAVVKEDFGLLLKLQEASHSSNSMKAFLADLQWPLQTYTMEVFYMLYETGFQELTPELKQLLQGFSRSWLASIVDEDAFNRLRSNATGHAAGQMGRCARWGNLSASDLIEEKGRKSVKVTSTAKAQATGSVPKSAFVATSASDFDLGADTLETMQSPSWPHPGPLGHKLVGAAWEAWRASRGDAGTLLRSWLCLLASPGCILADKDRTPLGVVLGATAWCVFYMPLEKIPKKKNGTLFHAIPNSKLQTVVIQDAKKWRAARFEVVSPVQAAIWTRDANYKAGVTWRYTDGSTLAQYAARDGFRLMTKPVLEKLVAHEGLRFPKGQQPKTVDAIVKALIFHFLPQATPAIVEAALARRGRAVAKQEIVQQSALAVGCNAEGLFDCVDEDDHEIIMAAVDKAKAACEKPGSCPNPEAKSASWKRKPVDPNKEYDLEAGRSFLPSVKGCTLSLDEVRFTRWCGCYPRLTPPRYVTKSYGPQTGLTNTQALFYVLKQLWTWHTQETNDACPWQFADP